MPCLSAPQSGAAGDGTLCAQAWTALALQQAWFWVLMHDTVAMGSLGKRLGTGLDQQLHLPAGEFAGVLRLLL